MKEGAGISDDEVKEVLAQLEGAHDRRSKDCIDWAHSDGNQGSRLRKTKVNLWFITGTSKGRIIDAPGIVLKICWTTIAKYTQRR